MVFFSHLLFLPKKKSHYIIIMIVTLNSTNKDNYQWTNYFNETLTLKANSIIKVKNINVFSKKTIPIFFAALFEIK